MNTPDNEPLWYLAYGSNMNPKTLTERRKVHPTESKPCRVPNYTLIALSGFPYFEPGFADIAPSTTGVQVHGVLHRITGADYKRIRQTEGGGGHDGLGYQDEWINTITYDGQEVKAVTLRTVNGVHTSESTLFSKRYKTLLVDGAKLHRLEPHYQEYLASLPSFDNGTWRKRLAQLVCGIMFFALAMPFFLSFFLSMSCRCKIPRFIHAYFVRVSVVVWFMHDNFFRYLFGSGANNDY